MGQVDRQKNGKQTDGRTDRKADGQDT